MDNLDLNIDSYSISDIEKLFSLPGNYNDHNITTSHLKLCNMHNNNNNILLKDKIIDFLDRAKEMLITHHLNNEVLSSSVMHTLEKNNNIDVNIENYKSDAINPIKQQTISKCLTIDTRFRDNYLNTKSSDFIFNLPEPITNVLSMKMSSIELPFTFYSISEKLGNNYFHYSIISDISNNITLNKIEIPDGNYKHSILIELINDLFKKNNHKIKLAIDIENASGSGKTIINSMNTFKLYFNKDSHGNDSSLPIPLKLGWILGFRHAQYGGQKLYVSEGIFELIGPRYIFLVVDEFNNNKNDSFVSAFNSSILNKNILARISSHSSQFNIYVDNNFNNNNSISRKYFGPININKLKIQLLDEYGRIISLNNMDFSFSLNLECLYQ